MAAIEFVTAGQARVKEVRSKAIRFALIDLGGELKWIPKSVMATPCQIDAEQGGVGTVVSLRVKGWYFEKEL